MKFKRKDKARNRLRKRTQRGFKGSPVATVVFTGPDDKTALKVAVTLVGEDGVASGIRRWYAEPAGNLFKDSTISKEILAHIEESEAPSVAFLDKIDGCACIGDEQMPDAVRCNPSCTFWEDKERFTTQLRELVEKHESESESEGDD